MHILLPLFLWFSSEQVFARNLKSSADKLLSETTKIGTVVAAIGLVLGGIYYLLGKNDAGNKMTGAIIGAGVIFLAPGIVNFIKGIA